MHSTRGALEAAVALCVTRTNYNVEIEHWLLKLLEQSEHRLRGAVASVRR